MNKASGGDGISAELFQILKDDAVKCCTQYASKLGKLSSGHRTGKGQFSFQSQRKAMPKNVLLLLLLNHFSCVRLLEIPWTAAYQASPPMRFSRQEYWSGVPLPSPSTFSKSSLNIWKFDSHTVEAWFGEF